MSLEINNAGILPQSAYHGIQSRQAELQVGGYPLVSKLPAGQTARDTAPASADAMREFVVAAQNAAAQIGNNDPMKPVADGIARDLGRANGDVFGAMGQINDLQNAFAYALESTNRLMSDPALQGIH